MKRPARHLINETNFWAKVTTGRADDCWLWTAANTRGDYGTFTVGNRTFIATHVALTLDGRERPEPPSNVALHGDCSNPRCVNPAHLRWGTQKENIADKYRLGRADRRSGADGPRAKLTASDVAEIRASVEPSTVIGPRYGVTPSNVRHIRRGLSWKSD